MRPAAIAPTLRTDRLRLRMSGIADVEDSAAMWADPRVVAFIGGRPFTPEEVWNRLLRYAGLWSLLGYGYWTIRERATDRFVGEIGFANYRRAAVPALGDTPECGWVLAPWAHGGGFAREALAAVLAWADGERALGRTCCMIEPANAASIRLAARFGYRLYAGGGSPGVPVLLFERDAPGPAARAV
jgi:RimJ/RimL family protein N-acetyltransferase